MRRVFESHVRVPYAHVDRMNFVYYAHYYLYFEMARSELLRAAGLPYAQLEESGVILPVVSSGCEYRKPAHYDDWLTLHSQCQWQGARLRIDYTVRRDTERLAIGYTVHVCMSSDGKVLRPPEALVASLSLEPFEPPRKRSDHP